MRGIHTALALATMAAAVGVAGAPGSLRYRLPSEPASKHDPERVAKAQAKRERKQAKRLKGMV